MISSPLSERQAKAKRYFNTISNISREVVYMNKLKEVSSILNYIVFLGLTYKKAVLNLPVTDTENILLYSSLAIIVATFLVQKLKKAK